MIITQTPLRISFAGGGTDFPDFFKKHAGQVVSTAIDKYIFVVIKERFDDRIYVNWSIKEIVDSVGELKHELVREAMKKVGVKKGVEISFFADIPSEGAGLGSSSSVTVGTLNALYHYIGYTPPAEQLAREACKIEIDILRKPIGKQDQYIAAYGGLRFFKFNKNGRVTVEQINLPNSILEDLDNQLMLFFTGRTRKSENILSEQKENIKSKEQQLLKLSKLALNLRDTLKLSKVEKIGGILHTGWLIKKQLASGISDSEIDRLYEKALAAGAVGGKITGAGGGGFLLLVVPGEKRNKVRKALSGLREMPFRFERDGSKVIFNVRRY